ncbi:MAG: hypothetical protein KDA87_04915 [Planctomycetales bacterium]|nr:hypothetical protein [Planctomycetales bacterium]
MTTATISQRQLRNVSTTAASAVNATFTLLVQKRGVGIELRYQWDESVEPEMRDEIMDLVESIPLEKFVAPCQAPSVDELDGRRLRLRLEMDRRESTETHWLWRAFVAFKTGERTRLDNGAGDFQQMVNVSQAGSRQEIDVLRRQWTECREQDAHVSSEMRTQLLRQATAAVKEARETSDMERTIELLEIIEQLMNEERPQP